MPRRRGPLAASRWRDTPRHAAEPPSTAFGEPLSATGDAPVVLTDEEIERLRRSGIVLDARGRFLHEGAEITHHGLRAALWRWLARNPDGRYVLRLDDRRFVYLDVEDAPHAIRSLRWEGDRAIVLLADGSEEPLAPETLFLDERGIAYARVKRGSFAARLADAAFTALGEHLQARDGAVWLDAGGRSYRIAEVGS